ncbi:MAG: IclR family transcriptional regulator [Frankiales bacterium]|nr:IclR family transcriptional regulator [Frankiales bacterium]
MQPVVRALRVLTSLADHGGGLGLQELADLLGLPPSTVYRLTAVLIDEGFVVRTGQGKRFMLGAAVRRLVASTSSDYVRRVAEPTMARLNRATGETVFLAELVGKEAVCFAIMQGTRPLRMYVQLGSSLPLHAAASARVLLAHLDEVTAAALLDEVEFTQWTPRTITDRRELVRHLELIRDRGYDICDDEMENHVWAVAAPLRDIAGEVRAALAVVAPLPTVGDAERRAELQSAVVSAAAELSTELGAGQSQAEGSASHAATA